LKDRRTIAERWESDGQIIAYVWATFTYWPGYGVSGAHIEDILVTREFRRKGVALQVIRHVEELARERGATILRSGTGIENLASQAMHRKAGFYVERTEFEKEL
jgi:GNAT superfamily N-acetyltransferase